MAIELKNTKSLSRNGVKILVYGRAGSGKTTLIKTLPDPIIISAEGGMLSLADTNLPVYEITSFEDLIEAYLKVIESDHKSIAIDSISEIAEVILNTEKKSAKDAAKDSRQAYGTMQDKVAALIRAFRDIKGKHVYFSAKQEKIQDDLGRLLYSVMMPGTKIGNQMPYFFDEVLCARSEKNSDGVIEYALQTKNDGIYEAKDRSGKLNQFEPADLGAIIKKIEGV